MCHCLIVTLINICPPHVEIGFHGKKSMSLPFGFGGIKAGERRL